MGLVVSVPLVVVTVVLLVLVLLMWVALVIRPNSVRLAMMGLSSRRGSGGMEHGMLDLDPWDTYVLAVRSPQLLNMHKSVLRGRRNGNISAKTRYYVRWLGLEHAGIIYQHEKRYMNPVAAALATVMRFVSFHLCFSNCVDEFFVDGKLAAFAASNVMGDTIRAMWYYSADTKNQLFFFAVQLSIWRAYEMKLRYVDLGPSPRSQRSAKEKMGVVFHNNYREGYYGENHRVHGLICPAENMVFEAV